ncbi:MAG: hypothetical protein MR308_09245 [Lachnospiraceae bacterium]|nr:hypothetical protein [Lachnospiraceae bacterium]
MITYGKGTGKLRNWLIGEDEFLMQYQGKAESILYLANGYMGIRSALEEVYPFQTRGMFAAGCFNSCQGETIELPNLADSCEMKIILNGEIFSMLHGKLLNYSRYLNMYTAELRREVLWESPMGKRYQLVFRRCVSRAKRHLYGSRVEITPLDEETLVSVETGINARMTNSGVQHFVDGNKKVLNYKLLYLDQKTTDSGITMYHCSGTRVEHVKEDTRSFGMERRKLHEKRSFRVEKSKSAVYEKLAVLYTSHDLYQMDDEIAQEMVVSAAQNSLEKGYEKLFEESAGSMKKFWDKNDILIKTENEKLQLAIRFAQYHLSAMVPTDNHSSIAAKGLSGEGYKGHVFWDTEIFMLPYFQYTDPKKARNLLEYRVQRIKQAKKNARKKGYKGLMFPWESAITGEEETPLFASMDIMTGKAAHVWAGIKEHHITADIAYAVWLYYLATLDKQFMEKGGNDIIIGSALFWLSRSVFKEEKNRYEILDIIGPDEYTEHIDNNTYTNYMACFVVKKALEILNGCSPEEIQRISESFAEENIREKLVHYLEYLYLPQPREDGVLPQDDTFMTKEIIDVLKYRQDDVKQMILKKYSRKQVNEMQVLKQADTVMLLALMPELFDKEIKEATWNYYEPKTIHDSSLSHAVYSIVASDNQKKEAAYESFLGAIDIDMGPNPYSSNEGIHAAAMGGIWMAVVRGFAGFRMDENGVHITPCLPDEISGVEFGVVVCEKEVRISIDHNRVSLVSSRPDPIKVWVKDRMYELKESLIVCYSF